MTKPRWKSEFIIIVCRNIGINNIKYRIIEKLSIYIYIIISKRIGPIYVTKGFVYFYIICMVLIVL